VVIDEASFAARAATSQPGSAGIDEANLEAAVVDDVFASSRRSQPGTVQRPADEVRLARRVIDKYRGPVSSTTTTEVPSPRSVAKPATNGGQFRQVADGFDSLID
jgi:hypothetical protein